MAEFMVRFLICNVFISIIIGILLIVRNLFRNSLSSRMQYNLWFLLLGILYVPFVPLRLIDSYQFFSWLPNLIFSPASAAKAVPEEEIMTIPAQNADWMNDFVLSVNSKTPSVTGYILLGIWLVGIFAMVIFVIKSSLRLRSLKKSALPLQNQEVRQLYSHCLNEMNIHRNIPIYSTAFLKSPVITGLLRPCIYLPIHLISLHSKSDIRYMLLHELQHYKHHDTIASYLMNLTKIIYWFNPFVWYAIREMHADREIACDASVLKMLQKDEYIDYGNTLINFSEKISLTPFPFTSEFLGDMKHLKRRIINIASYKEPTLSKKLKGLTAFILTAVILCGVAPFLSIYASDESSYQKNFSSDNVSYADLSSYFGEYEGSFVLYNQKSDTWNIYNKEHASLRVAPDSTYKIYNALFGLEENIITSDDSLIEWNGETYPFEAWNADQTLQSAMSSSVNWYFQTVDEQLGESKVYDYIQKIGYGNENISGNFSTYWMESSLKISPIEQVELLIKLENNSFGFTSENIKAVKDAICLSSSDTGTLYGKTGTGRVDGQDVNGWFIGFIETGDNTYFFAANIGANENATGNTAAEIAMSILSDMNI